MFRPSTRLFCGFFAVISIISFCSSPAKSATSEVEKLLTVAPDNMVGFLATSGADNLKPSFNKTSLGQIWNDPGVQTFYQSIKQEIFKKIKQEMADPHDANTLDAIMNFTKLALNRPVIIGSVHKHTKEDKFPFYGFAIIDAGPRKAEINLALDKLEKLVSKDDIIEIKIANLKMHSPKPPQEVLIYWGWVGNYFIVAVNDSDSSAVKYLSKPHTVVPTYLDKVPATGEVMSAYVDCQKIADIINSIAIEGEAQENIKPIIAAIKELGLNNIKSITCQTDFVGSNIVTNELIEVPSPRTGLLASFKNTNPSLLDMADARAVNALAFNHDISRTYDTILQAIKIASPNDVYPELQKGIESFEAEAKFSLRNELIKSLAGPIVNYTIPSGAIMEAPAGGIVVIAKLKDPAMWEKSMAALENFVRTKNIEMLQINSQTHTDGKTLHCWVVPPLAMMQTIPCWAVVNNNLVIASNTALYDLAAKQIDSSAPQKTSIRSTEGYQNAVTKLPDNMIFLRYVDSQMQFKSLMMSLQQIWPMVTMVANQQGINLPFMLPSVAHIIKDMEPSLTYIWFDDRGIRAYQKSTGVEKSLGSVAGVSLTAGVMMPALAKVRQIAHRMSSGTNLSAIGKALLVYASDHDEKYPPNLQILIEEADLSQKTLQSPRKPEEFDGPSYIYITGQSPSSPPDNVLVYENPAFCSEMINVLFNDLHVEAMTPEEFLKNVQNTYKRLEREIPEIRFKDSIRLRSSNKSWSPEAKAWAIGCAAVLNERNHDRHDTLLPCNKNEKNIETWKKSLDKWWGVNSREDLFDSLRWIEEGGHRKRFDNWGKYIQTLSEEQYQNLVEEKSSDKDKLCEILIAKEYYGKLGKKSLLGWDYSRYICLCRWGYLVGYISEDEAWDRIMPVAEMLQKKFDSWEDLGQNYLIGRRFWSHKYTTENGDLYEDAFHRLLDMRSSPWNKYPWNMNLEDFETAVDPNATNTTK